MNTKQAIRVAILGLVVLVAGLIAAPALAAGPSVASIYTSVNPATAGQGVTFTVVVRGTFQSPLGLIQLFDGLQPLGPPLVLSPDFDSPPVVGGPKIIPTDHSTASLTRSFSPGTHLITVSYTGDGPLGNLPIFGGGLISLVVTAAQSTTTVSSSVNPSVYGQSVTLTASASSSGSPASGSIQFKADGANLGSPQPVDPSGNASVTTSALSVANHPVSADFSSGTPAALDSSGSLAGGQVVNPADTTTAVSSSANPSEFGAAVTFTASTSVNSPGSGTATGSVQFQDNGTNLGPPQSLGSSGQASIPTSGLSVGNHTISAAFTSGSANFKDSAGNTSQTVNKARTTLSYDGAAGADFNDPALLSARLTRTDDSSPVAGKTVTLTMGAESCAPVTDANGEAACTITPSELAGPFTATAVFNGDGNYEASSDSKPFSVTREETTTTYTGPTVIAQANPVTLSGRLLEDGITPIVGRTLTLTLGTGAGSQNCLTGPTDAGGNAHCTVASVTVTQGPEPVKAEFAGDGYYLPSADASKNVIVFAFPTRGVFVIGNLNNVMGGPVTFWSERWRKLNTLSGGKVPGDMQGFVSVSPSPHSCGTNWTISHDDPCKGGEPPRTVLSYMGTLVSSSIKKANGDVMGNTVSIVVVKVNRDYGNQAGESQGTGTIVATYC